MGWSFVWFLSTNRYEWQIYLQLIREDKLEIDRFNPWDSRKKKKKNHEGIKITKWCWKIQYTWEIGRWSYFFFFTNIIYISIVYGHALFRTFVSEGLFCRAVEALWIRNSNIKPSWSSSVCSTYTRPYDTLPDCLTYL